MILPKGTRMGIVLWPGEKHNISLDWVETDKGWECYTTLPGVNNWGRVDSYHCETVDKVLLDIKLIYDTSQYWNEADKLAFKGGIRAEAGVSTWGYTN